MKIQIVQHGMPLRELRVGDAFMIRNVDNRLYRMLANAPTRNAFDIENGTIETIGLETQVIPVRIAKIEVEIIGGWTT